MAYDHTRRSRDSWWLTNDGGGAVMSHNRRGEMEIYRERDRQRDAQREGEAGEGRRRMTLRHWVI